MIDRALVFEDFTDKVGQVFTISDEGAPAIALSLTEASLLNPAYGLPDKRPPFSLIFLAKEPRVLEQRIYRMAHNGLGELSMFIVPVGKTAEGVSYQAVFN